MPDWTLDYKDDVEQSGELEYMDPRTLSFAMRGDVLRVTIESDRTYLKVHAVRAFPLTEPNEYIGLVDAIGAREIGMLRNLKDLPVDARQLVQKALEKRYFVPKINRIIEAKREFGTVYWTVDTDRGDREFIMRGIRDSLQEIEPGRYLVIDIDGNRFEIKQLNDLDSHSQAQWDRLI